MERIAKFFATLVSMTDQAILEVLQTVETQSLLESAFLRAEIMAATGNVYRRLKAALNMKVDQLVLSFENLPYLTDVEIQTLFIQADPDSRAQFVLAVFNDNTENGQRAKNLLEGVQGIIDEQKAEKERQAEEERQERERAKKAARRLELLDQTDKLILHILQTGDASEMTDELAVQYMMEQPLGYFKVLADVAGLITPAVAAEGEAALTGLDALRGGTIVDMLTGKVLAVKDARSIRNCLVTDEEGAKRLVKKLPKKEGGGREIYRHLTGDDPEGVLERLDRHDAEYAARQKRDETFAAEVKEAIGQADATFVALAKAVAELVEINSVGTSGPEEWKMRIIRDVSGEFVEVLRRSYIGQLRQAYPTTTEVEALNARIEEVKAAWNQARAAGAPSYEENALLKEVHILERHKQYLLEAPKPQQGNGKPTVGTHAHTKGTADDPVLTDHSRDDDKERKERERREADRQRTLATKGKGGGKPQLTGKGKHQKGGNKK